MTSHLQDAPLHSASQPVLPYSASSRPPRAWRGRLLRLAAVVAGLAVWFSSQAMIGRLSTPNDVIGDRIHTLTASVNEYLNAHPHAANDLLIVSSAGIDALGLFLLLSSIFGRTIRPFLGLLVLFGLRQTCLLLCTLPPPQGMIWGYPGVPSLLVTYGVSNDLFFSGHTALAVYGCLALAQIRGRYRPLLVALGTTLALFEVAVVLVLRAHYTIDVFAGAVTAFAVTAVAARLAPPVDRWIARLAGEGRGRGSASD